MLFRSEGLIKELQGQLDGLPDEEQTPLIQRLAALNQAKVTIAHKLQRLIL